MTTLEIWTRYRVRWTFLTSVCGSVPADPEIVAKWIAARTPARKPAEAKTIEAINEEVLETIPPVSEPSLLVFQRHEGALVVRAGTIRAHIKDCARQISALYVAKIKGTRAFSGRVLNACYLPPEVYWVPLRHPPDGAVITSPSGERDKPIHVKGPGGQPIDALKRLEYVVPPVMLEFELRILGTAVPRDDLDILFSYGGTHGYGGERGDGEGRYQYEIGRVE